MFIEPPQFNHQPLYKNRDNIKAINVEINKTQRICPLVILSENQKRLSKKIAKEFADQSKLCKDQFESNSRFKEKCEYNGIALEIALSWYFDLPYLPEVNRYHKYPDICGPEGFGADVRCAAPVDHGLLFRNKDREDFAIFSGAIDNKTGGFILIGWDYGWRIREWEELRYTAMLPRDSELSLKVSKHMKNPDLVINYPRCRLNPTDSFNRDYFR